MKCCLHSNQSNDYKKKASEIKIPYKNRLEILDYIEDFPNITLILDLHNCYNDEIDWEEIKKYGRR